MTLSWISWSFLSCISFGTVNFITSIMSRRHDANVGTYAAAFGYLPFWILYRLFGNPELPLLTPKVNKPALIGVIIRGFSNFALTTVILLSFKFAGMAQMNAGVIASVLTTAVFFTVIVFGVVYRERMTITDWIGAIILMSGVSIIGLFK